MKYILIILIAVIITGAVMSITTGLTKQIKEGGEGIGKVGQEGTQKNLCDSSKSLGTRACITWNCTQYFPGDSYFTTNSSIDNSC